MGPYVDHELILQEPSDDAVLSELAYQVKECAILGAIDVARELETLYNTVRPMKFGDTWRLSYLNHAWAATGHWPEGVPEDMKTAQALRNLQSENDSSWPSSVDPRHRFVDEVGLRELLKAVDFTRPRAHLGCDDYSRLVKALDVALELAERDSKGREDQSFENIARAQAVGRTDIYERCWRIVENIAPRCAADNALLLRSKRVLPFLLNGTFRIIQGLDERDVEIKAKALLEAFKQRVIHGQQQPSWWNDSIASLLSKANENTCCVEEPWEYFDHDVEQKSLFHSPASNEAIMDLEERLGVSLPNDYKEFLHASNGFGYEHVGIWNGDFTGPPFHSIGNVKWTDDECFRLDVDLLEIPGELYKLAVSKDQEDKDEKKCSMMVPVLDRELEIGQEDITQVWLVHPELVRRTRESYYNLYEMVDEDAKAMIDRLIVEFAGSRAAFDEMEWCCVEWTSGGVAQWTAYPSFRNYLQHWVLKSFQKG